MSDQDADDDVMLTTLDNPYNPFESYEEWYAFDTQKGYNTCEYLARVAKTSPELSEADESRAILEAIKEIIFYNINGLYVGVTRKDFDEKIKGKK